MSFVMDLFEKHRDWPFVKEVLKKLHHKGFKAYLVGGCVRDLLLKRKPTDFDIASDARPEDVRKIFPQTLMIGATFGVAIIPFSETQIEVTTFRSDLDYKDGRRPEAVIFSTPEEDAKRRDFTINALFFDVEKAKVMDYVGGVSDLNQKILRAVGEPDLRFNEDYLRPLRALRFSAQLGFQIEPKTYSAILKTAQIHKSRLNLVARERVFVEFKKLVLSQYAHRGLSDLIESEYLFVLFPSGFLSREKNIKWIWSFSALNFEQKVAALTLNISEDSLEAGLRGLRFSKKEMQKVLYLVKTTKYFLNPENLDLWKTLKILNHEWGTEWIQLITDVCECEILGFNVLRDCINDHVSFYRSKVDESGFLPLPQITGKELKKRGLEGQEIAKELDRLYKNQILSE